eukprot:gene9004-18639_t
MDLLRAEINRKKKTNGDIIDAVNPEARIGHTRFVRQGDVKRLEDEKRAAAQRLLDEARILKATEKDFKQEHQQSRGPIESENVLFDYSGLSVEQVKQRLRVLRHPITLFGETDDDRRQRLIRIQSEEQQDDDFRLGSGHNLPNTFLNRRGGASAPEKDDEDDEDDDVDINGLDDRPDTDNMDASNINCLKERKSIQDLENITYSEVKGLAPEKIIYKYFRSLLKRWEWDLNAREDRDKLTAKGKIETKTQKQCKDYIRPLFRFCKRGDIPEDIRDKLVLIVKYCEQGNFRSAHDEYLKTAIGNAAWPIGLTMVGIHERSGREKISSSKVAHVMNNECQRKYLTSIKRLMTYAQTKRPDVPPSMKCGICGILLSLLLPLDLSPDEIDLTAGINFKTPANQQN